MKKLILYILTVCSIMLGGGNPVSAFAQSKEYTITGTVLDLQGQPMVGVNVIVKNQPGLGTNTDIDGKYKIKTGANETLSFSYLGYATQDIPIAGKTRIDVKLAEDSNAMEEVVVVGAGFQKKASVVGAVTSIKMEDLKVPTANITTFRVSSPYSVRANRAKTLRNSGSAASRHSAPTHRHWCW